MSYKNFTHIEDHDAMMRRIEEEVKARDREWMIEHNNKVMRDIEKRKQSIETTPIEQRPGYALDKYRAEAMARGEITNPFIREHLKAKITAARWTLALGMAMTLLFKGQWLLWIVFIVTYILTVRQFKKDALEADKK